MPIRHGSSKKAGLDLATRPFLTQSQYVERVVADIDTNHGNCNVQCLWGRPFPSSIVGRVGARPDRPINGPATYFAAAFILWMISVVDTGRSYVSAPELC